MARLSSLLGSGLTWLGRRLTSAPPPSTPQERTREKVAAGPRGIQFPQILPYLDDVTGESARARAAYRKMLADPNVKAPLFGKIFAVGALEPNFTPAVEDDLRAKLHADFVRWQYTERLAGGLPGLAWSVLSGGLVDGYSVCEKVRVIQVGGKWHGKYALRSLKAKDVGNDVILLTDEYRNVVGVQGQRYNAGEVYHPSDFVIWRNPGLYESPVGMSDLRAAYGRYWLLDTVTKLRAIGAEKRAFPVLVGHYQDGAGKAALEAALKEIKSSNWFAAPESARLEALDIAGRGDTYFLSFVKDLREEIVLAIAGALLQMLQGGAGVQRGASSVHKDTADLFKWWLVALLTALFNDYEHGLIREVIDLNFAGVTEYPKASFGGIDEAELAESLRIDQGLRQLGWKPSRKDLSRRYGRAWAESPEDEVQAPVPGGFGPPGLGVESASAGDNPAAAGPAVPTNDLRGSVGGSQAIADLQRAYYAEELAREAAMANAQLVFGFSSAEAEQLFPLIEPKAPGGPAGQADGTLPAPAPGQGFDEGDAAGRAVPARPFRFSEGWRPENFHWTEDNPEGGEVR